MFIIDDLDLEIWMTLERVQSLDNGNLIGQMSASRPSGPITAKLNLTRIYEYKVFIHIKQNQVLNGEKDLTCQWLKKKKTKTLNPFCFFSDVAPFIEFLKAIQDGTIVLMGTYDDGATKYVNFKIYATLQIYNL